MTVAAVILSYNNAIMIAKVIDALRKYEPNVDLYIIDNASETSESEIRPRLEAFHRAGVIRGYALFSRNITNNSFLQIIMQDAFLLNDNYSHIIVSDGDVEVGGPFVDRSRAIVDEGNYSCCAVRVDIRKIPVNDPVYDAMVMYSAPLLQAKRAGYDYGVRRGGFWMRLYRTEVLFDAVKVFADNGFRIRDGLIDKYFYSYCGKDAAILIDPAATELTHANYSKEYHSKKAVLSRSLSLEPSYNLYNHDMISDFVIVSGDKGPETIEPPAKIVSASPEHHRSSSDHPFFKEHIADVRSALVVERGASVGEAISRSTKNYDIVFVINSEFPRIYRESNSGIWISPLYLAGSFGSNMIHKVEIQFGSVKTRGELTNVLRFISQLLLISCRIFVPVLNHEEVFLTLAMSNSNSTNAVLNAKNIRDHHRAVKMLDFGVMLDLLSARVRCAEHGFEFVSAEKSQFKAARFLLAEFERKS